ncbi:hypothetical protein BKA57DRAFT_440833 [Linnemannia elongata]|nr:hypothetical protein BKA57DRAFT_440833 [Linnemannia elongata]
MDSKNNADNTESTTSGRQKKSWRIAFKELPHASYFESVKEPVNIKHLDYFAYANATLDKKEYYHHLWASKILPLIKNSTLECLRSQGTRLKREWSETSTTDAFWTQVLEDELSKQASENSKRARINAETHLVVQLKDAGVHLSKRMRRDWDALDSASEPALSSQEHATQDALSGEEDVDSEEEARGAARSLTMQCLFGSDFLSSDPIDPSICSDTLSQGTMEEPIPVRIDRMVGPGTLSVHLTGENDYWVGNKNISQQLNKWRREQVDDQSFLTDHDVQEILSLNFIFNHPLVKSLQEQERALWSHRLSEKEHSFVVQVSLACMDQEQEIAEQTVYSLAMKDDLMSSSVFRAARNLMATNALWADMVLVQDNEDSIIERFFKPLVNGFFGSVAGTKLCWTRDALKTGTVDTGELLYPDCMLTTVNGPQQTVLVAEVKKFDAAQQECDRDRVKLFVEMKRCVDGLLTSGVDGPVIGLLAQRHRVEVWALTLPYEAVYLPTHLGSFDMILSRFYFGALHVVCPPLLAAQVAVTSTMSRITGVRRRKPIKAAWTRGTYNVEPMELKSYVSVRQEARGLRRDNELKAR